MASKETISSRLPVVLQPLKPEYEKPARRNLLVPERSYDQIDAVVVANVKIGTDGVAYVDASALPKLLDLNSSDAAYVYDNQVLDADKRVFSGTSYANTSAIVGLIDKKAQEVRHADKQAKLQYSRDSLINASDSDQAQNIRRQCDSLTNRELPKLGKARGVDHDELTNEPLLPGAAFHHVNPRKIHTNPVDALDPTKGRMLNPSSHKDVHKNNVNSEAEFEKYKAKKNNS